MHSSVWLSGLSVWMSVCTSYVQFTEQLSHAGLHAKMRNASSPGHRRPSRRLPPSPSSRLPRPRLRHQNLKKIATPSRIWTKGGCARVYLCVCVCVCLCVCMHLSLCCIFFCLYAMCVCFCVLVCIFRAVCIVCVRV